MKKVALFFTICLVALSGIVYGQQRTEITLEKGWMFTREDNVASQNRDYDDRNWESVRIPHDWAIYGPFSPTNDRQDVAITQDGQEEAVEHAGRTGGLPFVGVGWYRNVFDVPNFSASKKVSIQFDGAMSNAVVYVNGKEAGTWKYGYNTFHFDITEFLNKDGKGNSLAVRLENFTEQSRWYPGAGLYRNVHLIVTNESHIPIWGTYVTTPRVSEEFAEVNIKTKIEYPTDDANATDFELETIIKDTEGNPIAQQIDRLDNFSDNEFNQSLIVMNPLLWDVKQPNLYSVESKLIKAGTTIDSYKTKFGIRTIEIIPDQGFFLNGRRISFKGVCMHHDLGPLGAAVNDAAIRRQIRILQDMGVNAIRTAHNMPAPELVRAADEMGMMLAVETFDEWGIAKVKNGYNKYFDEWAEKDVVNVVHHYRNNPSVVMWFIGNEVLEQGVEWGSRVARFLQDVVQREDPTRFVSLGMDRPDAAFKNGMGAVIEIPGFNYRTFKYEEAYRRLPQQIILGAETASTVSSRGVYKFPVGRKSMAKYDDHQSSSYDLEHCSWSDLPEDNFVYHEDLAPFIGEFVWTGFDYLGEPTPYYTDWPSHSSLFGIVDLAGIPKDRYYLYRSHWNSDKETLHILPHWTWNGREGEITPVFVYTNHPTVELFINGKSQGKRTKDASVKIDSTFTDQAQKELVRQKRYRLMWMDTKYEPGTVKAVAYDGNGNAVAEQLVHTAGEPHHLVLEADRNTIKADGKDLSFITVSIVDKDGNLCPHVNDLVKFEVKGEGTYRAGANGNSVSLDLFHLPEMHFFNGKLTAIVESTELPGTIQFKASAKGVKDAILQIETTN